MSSSQMDGNFICDQNHNEQILNYPTIKEFFNGANVFVTGGTGFLGKVLIEKLLRSCDGVKTIYVLLRGKRGLTSEERYKDFIKNEVFDRVRDKDEGLFKKLVCVAGDINQPKIGLSDWDRKQLKENVNIVFHVAATVRFIESLRDAANLNTIGTKSILELCSEMNDLKSIVHISTAYSNPMRKVIEERVYPTQPVDLTTFLKCLDAFEGESIELVADRIQGKHPNTYTLTKSMAESLIANFKTSIPICIVRPSIVTAADREPFPGWIDNINGVTGILTEIQRGTVSSIMGVEQGKMDLIPVDIVVNTVISAAWANTFVKSETVQVYNCTSGELNPVTWCEFKHFANKAVRKNPTKYVMLYPGFKYRTNRKFHRFFELLLHFLPAYVFDIIMRIQGTRPKNVKIANKLQIAANAGEYFVMHDWDFVSTNQKMLIKSVQSTADGDEFNCDISYLDWDLYIEKYMLGIRKHVLKDGLESMGNARKKLKRLYWIQKIFQFGLLVLFYNLILKHFIF